MTVTVSSSVQTPVSPSLLSSPQRSPSVAVWSSYGAEQRDVDIDQHRASLKYKQMCLVRVFLQDLVVDLNGSEVK